MKTLFKIVFFSGIKKGMIEIKNIEGLLKEIYDTNWNVLDSTLQAHIGCLPLADVYRS